MVLSKGALICAYLQDVNLHFQFSCLKAKRPAENQLFFFTHYMQNASFDWLTVVKENQGYLWMYLWFKIQRIRAHRNFENIIKNVSSDLVFFMDKPPGYLYMWCSSSIFFFNNWQLVQNSKLFSIVHLTLTRITNSPLPGKKQKTLYS